jgi:hypothetical protein
MLKSRILFFYLVTLCMALICCGLVLSVRSIKVFSQKRGSFYCVGKLAGKSGALIWYDFVNPKQGGTGA